MTINTMTRTPVHEARCNICDKQFSIGKDVAGVFIVEHRCI